MANKTGTPARRLDERLGDTFSNGEMTDITFKFNCLQIVDKAIPEVAEEVVPITTGPSMPTSLSTIQAHKVILAVGSPVFKAMFYGPWADQNDVVISDVTANAFRKMLEYLYTDNTILTADDVTEVLYVAKKYDVGGLEKLCIKKISDMLSRDTAVTIYPQALLFGENELAQRCLDTLDKNAHYIINTNNIVKEIDRNLFQLILQRDTFCAREVDIWDAMIWWAKQSLPESRHDPDDIRDCLGDMLFMIRFAQMTPKELLHIVLPARLLKAEEIMEALHYAMPKKKRGECKNLFPSAIRALNQEIVLKCKDLPVEADYLGGKYRLERVVEKGYRCVRFRADHRVFLRKISLSNVPSRVSVDKYVVTVRVIDCVLNEMVQNFEFNLTRELGFPPTPATYKLDLDPVELCPKIIYEVVVSIECPNPDTKVVKCPGTGGSSATFRVMYYGRVFSEECVVDELHFST